MNDDFWSNNQVKSLGYCAIGAAFGALILDTLRLFDRKKKGKK